VRAEGKCDVFATILLQTLRAVERGRMRKKPVNELQSKVTIKSSSCGRFGFATEIEIGKRRELREGRE